MNKNDKEVLEEFLNKWRKSRDSAERKLKLALKTINEEQHKRLSEEDRDKFFRRDHWTQHWEQQERRRFRLLTSFVKDLEVFTL